ncbi:MAG: glycosyl hydrolase family 16, partial [Balneolaceae bacterium]
MAQNNVPAIDFEVDGNGADWDWVTFENIDNPALEFIDNPDASGINESARVAKFTARADGQPWAGTTGRDGTTFLFDEANRTITIMVWKSVISNVGIKLETASGWSQGEILVANTKVNEWEEIVLDFTGREYPPNGEMFNGISVFPDFQNRDQENVIYFD